MQTILFDIDGTLVDTNELDGKLFVEAVEHVLGPVRWREDWNDYANITDSGILHDVLQDNRMEKTEARCADVRTTFGKAIDELLMQNPCAALPGARKALDQLIQAPRAQVGFATGGWGHTARRKLAAAELWRPGIPLRSSDDHHERVAVMRQCAEALAALPGSITYVGDALWDVRATKSLGWAFVGVGEALRGHCDTWVPHFDSPEWALLQKRWV